MIYDCFICMHIWPHCNSVYQTCQIFIIKNSKYYHIFVLLTRYNVTQWYCGIKVYCHIGVFWCTIVHVFLFNILCIIEASVSNTLKYTTWRHKTLSTVLSCHPQPAVTAPRYLSSKSVKVMMSKKAVLWIRIHIGSVFRSCVDPDPHM